MTVYLIQDQLPYQSSQISTINRGTDTSVKLDVKYQVTISQNKFEEMNLSCVQILLMLSSSLIAARMVS